MAMDLQLRWSRPVRLLDGASKNLIYTVDLDRIPKGAGVYVFCRRHGKAWDYLYVGQATRLRGRVEGQLNNVRLMKAIENAPTGRRWVLTALLNTKRGQQLSKALDVVERTLIEAALAEGSRLLNVQGARPATHSITSSGSRAGRGTFQTTMLRKV